MGCGSAGRLARFGAERSCSGTRVSRAGRGAAPGRPTGGSGSGFVCERTSGFSGARCGGAARLTASVAGVLVRAWGLAESGASTGTDALVANGAANGALAGANPGAAANGADAAAAGAADGAGASGTTLVGWLAALARCIIGDGGAGSTTAIDDAPHPMNIGGGRAR